MKKFSVIIPVHNSLNYTKRSIIEILTSQQNHGFDHNSMPVVIVDDGSHDGTSEWLSKHYPNIHVLRGDGNLWWSGAMNVGIKYSFDQLSMDYVLLWNNDITPSSDYFRNASQIINSDDHAIVCSMIFFKDEPDTLISTGNYFNRKNGKFGLYNYGVKESKANFADQQIDWVEGHGVLIRRDVFDSIGYFDEQIFPQYYGDSDLTLRATLSGYKIYFSHELKMWNDTSRTGTHARKGGIKEFINSFTSIRSNYNVNKDFKFYSKYATSRLAYKALIYKYLIYTLSFVKRQVTGIFKFH